MSSICGLAYSDGSLYRHDEITTMLNASFEPDFDRTEYKTLKSSAFGQHTLFITPESQHHQIIHSNSERQTIITMDGRLDYRDELISKLGCKSLTDFPDSYLILNAYHKWGENLVEHLSGEFAFAIWDEKYRRLICVTDPMGTRPLYYKHDRERFTFSSDIRALLSLDNNPIGLNEKRVAQLGVSFLAKSLNVEETHLKKIFHIPGATLLILEKQRLEKKNYWKPDQHQQLDFKSDGECREAYQEIFTKAIQTRIRGNHQVGALLSGGLDSSGIVSKASQLLHQQNQQLHTFSSIPMKEHLGVVADELEYMNHFKALPNLRMHFIDAKNKGPFDDLEKLSQLHDVFSYGFQHFLYSEFAHQIRNQNIRVVLDGFGGELSVTSYMLHEGYLSELLVNRNWLTLLRELNALKRKHGRSLSSIAKFLFKPLVAGKILNIYNKLHSPYSNSRLPFRNEFIIDTLGSEIKELPERLDSLYRLYPDHRKNMSKAIELQSSDPSQRHQRCFLGHQKIQFTYPYLDTRVLQFAIAVEGKFKYRQGVERLLYRIGMKDSLPNEIVGRFTKTPFCPDYALRYENNKYKAKKILDLYDQKLTYKKHIVDIAAIELAMTHKIDYNWKDRHPLVRNATLTVPTGAFWAAYLAQSF